MNFFIFGFQRLVWCPKCTPASNNSLTPILITLFLWLSVHLKRRTIPRNTGFISMLLWPPRLIRTEANSGRSFSTPVTARHREGEEPTRRPPARNIYFRHWLARESQD